MINVSGSAMLNVDDFVRTMVSMKAETRYGSTIGILDKFMPNRSRNFIPDFVAFLFFFENK